MCPRSQSKPKSRLSPNPSRPRTKAKSRNKRPNFAEEKALVTEGLRFIAGIDEVGRGALAGPLVAAAVMLPVKAKGDWVKLVRDSKLLTPEQREAIFDEIRGSCIAYGIGQVSHEVIDELGMTRATRLAMCQAVSLLSPEPEAILIDFFTVPELGIRQKGVVDGDTVCFSIACASIVAKVTRDHLMAQLDQVYPGYEFSHNKGYGTREHYTCLERLGPSPIHRHSFWPIAELLERGRDKP